MMLNNLRRFVPSFAAFALVAAPFGCSPDAPPSAVVEIPRAADSPTPILDKLDRDVRRTEGDAKHEANDLKRAVEETGNEAKHDLKAAEEELKRSADKAIDNALGDPK